MTAPSSTARRIWDALHRVRVTLRRVPLARWTWDTAFKAIKLARRRGQVARYLNAHEQRYLRLGSGTHTDPDWLSVDIRLDPPGVVFMDVTKPLPLPSGSFDAVQCEHVIEHISYEAGLAMLSECHRVLRTGGTVRIATPNLDLISRLINAGDTDPALKSYVEWSNSQFGTPAERRDTWNPAFAANRMVRHFGHAFIYDETTLRGALTAAGFRDVIPVTPGVSSHAELQGIDRHHEEIGKQWDDLETLALEGTA